MEKHVPSAIMTGTAQQVFGRGWGGGGGVKEECVKENFWGGGAGGAACLWTFPIQFL